MKQLSIIITAFSLLSISCNESKRLTPAAETSTRGAEGYNASITDIFWSLTEVNGKPVVQAPDDKLIYVKFNTKENKLEGNAGCNTMFGKFELNESQKIKMTVGSTKMACASDKMEIESTFLNALSNADSYLIKGDTMQLFKAKMTLLAKFEARYFPR